MKGSGRPRRRTSRGPQRRSSDFAKLRGASPSTSKSVGLGHPQARTGRRPRRPSHQRAARCHSLQWGCDPPSRASASGLVRWRRTGARASYRCPMRQPATKRTRACQSARGLTSIRRLLCLVTTALGLAAATPRRTHCHSPCEAPDVQRHCGSPVHRQISTEMSWRATDRPP